MARMLKIHPAIGVARVGRSPDQFFVGPEIPGQSAVPAGGYRDAQHLLKRQGARFRVFLYEDGAAPREVTSAEATIVWTVHLANTKAAGRRFFGAGHPLPALRNAAVTDRSKLTLDPGAASVWTGDPRKDLTFAGAFLDQPVAVQLGTVIAENGGSIVVLGGHGEAVSPTNAPLNAPGNDFANRDGWLDDTSDGPVTATVTFKDGSASPPVTPAWVLVAPPKYAPAQQSPVSLYDALRQIALDRGLLPNPFENPAFKPSFADDIMPILKRASDMRWLFANGQTNGPPAGFHHFNPASSAHASSIVNRLRQPGPTLGGPGVGTGDMPRTWSDAYPAGGSGTLTPFQYQLMLAWKNNNFDPAQPTTPGGITPAGLDRAALEPCVGGPLFPGIEASWFLRDKCVFVEAFRLDMSGLQPGDVTQQMAVPWQSDFLDCAAEPNGADTLVWWPAQRPVDVWTDPAGDPMDWARSFNGTQPMDVQEMIANGDRLGLLLAQGAALLEVDRVP
jgi:hypothetical protein